MTTRYGSARWHGDARFGSGTITVGERLLEGSYSHESRFADGSGTNPEQLLAAAHSGCFTMYLASILSAAGHTPASLRTKAHVRLCHVESEPTLTQIELATVGDAPGIDASEFRAYAERAKDECPVSWAVAGIPDIVLTAALGVAQSTGIE